VTPDSDRGPTPIVRFVPALLAVIRGPQLPVLRHQGRARPLLIALMSAALTFAVVCAAVAVLGQDWALLAVPACLAGPVLALAVGSSVVATPERLRAWGRELAPGSISLVAGVNVGPPLLVAGHLRVILVAGNGAARWVSARGFTDDQIRSMGAQLGASVAIDWDAQITPAELAARFPGSMPLWRAKPERAGPALSPAQAPGVYLALAGGAIVVLSLGFPFASSTFAALSSPIAGIPGIPAFSYDVGPSLQLELVGLLVGWSAAVAAVERLVLHRGSSVSALSISAALAGALVGAVAIAGVLSTAADPGFSTSQAGSGIAIFFFGLVVLASGAALDLVAPGERRGLRALPN
jgi:hypothetical protein